MLDKIDYKKVYYPPGGILVWIIILLELVTFGIAIIAMTYYAKAEPQLFHESRLQLNINIGTANTIILLTSGFCIAMMIHHFKLDQPKKSKQYLLLGIMLGCLFLILKGFEYKAKMDVGLVFGTNTFFNFYWMLTLFHVLHVVVGLLILGSIALSFQKEKWDQKLEDIEAGAAFWHLCDLIWLLIFPALYLIF